MNFHDLQAVESLPAVESEIKPEKLDLHVKMMSGELLHIQCKKKVKDRRTDHRRRLGWSYGRYGNDWLENKAKWTVLRER